MAKLRTAMLLGWAALAAVAVPQGAVPVAPDPNPAPSVVERDNAIWNSAYNRMVAQNDVWFDDGDFPRIVQAQRVIFSIWPEDYDNATNLGWLLQSMEMEDQALAVYVAFRKANPNQADAPYPEAWYWFRKRAFDKIPPLLERTIAMQPPPHPNSFRTLAHAYDRLGLLADSRRVWQKLLKLTPQDLAAVRNLGRVEEKIRQAGGR